MIRHLRDVVARRRGVELEGGFTLIELLIVIVVLGILAATVVFALTGVTGQSAQAACQSDGKSYETAVAAFQNAPLNTNNSLPTTTAELTGNNFGGPFLHAATSSTQYVVALSGDTLPSGTSFPATTAAGVVYVGKTGTQLVAYDNESSAAGNGCFAVS